MMYQSLVSVPHVVQKWLESELNGLGIDSSVYCPAVLSLLVGESCQVPDKYPHWLASEPDQCVFPSDPYWNRHTIETKRWQVLQCLLTACGVQEASSWPPSSLSSLSQLAAELVAVISALHEPRAAGHAHTDTRLSHDTEQWTGLLLTSADELTSVNSAATLTQAWSDSLTSQRYNFHSGCKWPATAEWHLVSRQQDMHELQPPAPSTSTHFRPISVQPSTAPSTFSCLRPLLWRAGLTGSLASLCLQPAAATCRLSAGPLSAFARVRTPPSALDWRPLYLRGRSIEDAAAPVYESMRDSGDGQPLYARGTADRPATVVRYSCVGPTEYPALRYEMAGGADTMVTFCAPLVRYDGPAANNDSDFSDDLVSGLMSDCRLVEGPSGSLAPSPPLQHDEAEEDSRLIDLCFAVSLRPCTPFPRLRSAHHPSIGLSRCESGGAEGTGRCSAGGYGLRDDGFLPETDPAPIRIQDQQIDNRARFYSSEFDDGCDGVGVVRCGSGEDDSGFSGPDSGCMQEDASVLLPEKRQEGRLLAWEFIDERNVINKKGGVGCSQIKSQFSDLDSIARADHLLSFNDSELFLSMCPYDVGCDFDFDCQLCHQLSSESPGKEIHSDGRYMSANSDDLPCVLDLVDMIEHVGSKRARRSCRRHKSLSDAVLSRGNCCSSQGLGGGAGDKRRRRHHTQTEGVRLGPESGARRP